MAVYPPPLIQSSIFNSALFSEATTAVVSSGDPSPTTEYVDNMIAKLIHETAHSYASGHDADFEYAMIDILNKLDFFLKKCGATLAPLDQSLLDLETISNQQTSTPDTSSYKGFTLEIVNKPYNDKVSQKIGVAKNQSGIILLQTNPSFTTTPQVLIDELKFIIDRDNLKAY
jgi:hypothetical protein